MWKVWLNAGTYIKSVIQYKAIYCVYLVSQKVWQQNNIIWVQNIVTLKNVNLQEKILREYYLHQTTVHGSFSRLSYLMYYIVFELLISIVLA